MKFINFMNNNYAIKCISVDKAEHCMSKIKIMVLSKSEILLNYCLNNIKLKTKHKC